jgi:hypothetical protein
LAVQARIAALKSGVYSTSNDSDEVDEEEQNRHEQEGRTIQDRIAALRGKVPEGESNADVAPYPTADDHDEAAAPYPVDDDDDPNAEVVAFPEVAHYPTGDDDVYANESYRVAPEYPVAPYPTGEEEDDDIAVAAYPITEVDGEVAGYPVVDAYPTTGEDLAYPVTDAYPDVGDNPDDEIGVTGAYESHLPDEAPEMGVAAAPSVKKVVKVDSQVVAFLPSHLQQKKRKAASKTPASSKTSAKKTKPETTSTSGSTGKDKVNEDYDKFMEEIEGLE